MVTIDRQCLTGDRRRGSGVEERGVEEREVEERGGEWRRGSG